MRNKNQESRVKNQEKREVFTSWFLTLASCISSRSCLLILCSCIFLQARNSFSLISTYETKATVLTVDNFSNFYTSADNRLFKFSSDGAFLYPYEENKYGKIGMVDATNTMKVLVFYPDVLTVVTLDKFLSPLSTYNFFDLGYQNVSAIASSMDGRLWFYDNTDFKLKKIDETGQIFRESQPLNVIVDAVPNPNFITEKDNVVYVNDPNIGIMVFDGFGSYGKTIPLKGLRKFQVFQDQVIYFDSNRLNAFNLTTLDLKSLSLPDSTDVIMAAIQKDRLGILKKDRVDFYRY
ncbi:MAG: hypothetical protein JWO06_2588 [Bacteroidota bacterium]|nr:hypothetical protein [Bacteroidota bacterium]